ncbi:MAG: hypothetical protein V7632_4946 [Bradyrhizobium sp.]|jgi:hypothetical protein
MPGRCAHAFGGWLAGCGAATAVISGVLQTFFMIACGGDVGRLLQGIAVLVLPSAMVFVITCLMTAIPAAVVVWLGEAFRIRSAMFFGCAGAVIGALSISVLMRSAAVWTSGVGIPFIVAGFVAGLTYYFVTRELAAYEHSM